MVAILLDDILLKLPFNKVLYVFLLKVLEFGSIFRIGIRG